MKRTLFETLSSNRIPSYREYCETKTNENSLIRKNLFSSKECINLDVAQDSLRRNNLLRSFPKSITAAFKKRPVSLFYQKIRKSDIMQTDSL